MYVTLAKAGDTYSTYRMEHVHQSVGKCRFKLESMCIFEAVRQRLHELSSLFEPFCRPDLDG